MATDNKIKLNDGTEIEPILLPSLGAITVLVADVEDLQNLKDMLTEDNLSAVEIYNGAGHKTGAYEHLALDDLWHIIWVSDGIEATFGLRQKTDQEIRIENIEKNMQITDGAVNSLAGVVGEVAAAMAAGSDTEEVDT
ncbi:MAG TPA: hypothetical protein IAB09_07240 [Candidatus Avilachnospira avicola]|nr:hypothetical protein [Candidatus Avilachnospira avicola]